jgi:hypothetical protein
VLVFSGFFSQPADHTGGHHVLEFQAVAVGVERQDEFLPQLALAVVLRV